MPLEIMEVPLAGKVLEVNVNPGDKIAEGSQVCTIESMKMENPILAPVSGVVKEIKVSPGQVIKAGETIAVIEY
ncbi:MAG TPA: HlyD family efflux transporter periplasmic adaptor subunit [Dehalococcoidia bacterium]|nr:HlyD family efflux transporter periplasmic adaptor subunit [Dehalococcoidia bacterium]